MHAGARLCWILAASLVALPAAAQPSDPVAAAALFKDGRDAVRRGDYAAACPKFAESFRLDPGLGTLVNLAQCEDHTGKVASAWQHYVLAKERLGAGDDRLPIVKERLAAILPRVPRLTLVLAADAPAGTTVARDGVDLGAGSVGTALPTDPGEHTFEARAPGRAPNAFKVTLAEGEQRRLEVTPGAVLPPGSKAPSGLGTLGVIGVVTGGVGVVGLGIGVATGVVLRSKASAASADCPGPTFVCMTQAGYDAAQSGKTLTPINAAAWIAGGLLTAAGVTLVVIDRVGDRPAPLGFKVLPGGAAITGTF